MGNFGKVAWFIAAAWVVVTVPANAETTEDYWPDSLKAFGEGYPTKESRCRRVGDSAATAPFVDRTTMLVGCPGPRSSYVTAKFLHEHGGRAVAIVDGFTLIAMPLSEEGAGARARDRSVTGQLRCSRSSTTGAPCTYRVVRRDGGIVTVTIAWPDGKSRAIYFSNGKVVGADTNKADGSAKFRVQSVKELDVYAVTVGPEFYEIPDSVIGGS